MQPFITSFIALWSLNLIIFIHELGHCIASLLSNVPVFTFSIGFGPSIFSFIIHKIIFQLSLFPLGGYVVISQKILSEQTFAIKSFIILAGIAHNFLWGYLLLSCINKSFLQGWKQFHSIITSLGDMSPIIPNSMKKRSIIGPLGILSILKESITHSPNRFILVLSYLNINIALFNILPLPFLDGGQLLVETTKFLKNNFGDETTYLIFIFITIVIILLFASLWGKKLPNNNLYIQENKLKPN